VLEVAVEGGLSQPPDRVLIAVDYVDRVNRIFGWNGGGLVGWLFGALRRGRGWRGCVRGSGLAGFVEVGE
jgi:hypothetical protein